MRGIEPGQDHDELVAAEAREDVGLAHGPGEALRDRLQQQVAGIVAQRVVDALEVVEVEEQARDVVRVALRLRQHLPQLLVEQRPVRQPGQDVVLREPVGLRGGDLQLLRPLRDLVLQRALVARDFALRFGEPPGHVVERPREQADLVGRARRDVDVEPARADALGRAHQPPDRRDDAAREEQRGEGGRHQRQPDDGQRAEQVARGNAVRCRPDSMPTRT